METNTFFGNTSPETFYIAILFLASGLGIYGFYTILTLTRSPNYESRSFQTEKFMLGVFNILLSIFAIYTVVLIMQLNTGGLFSQTTKLIGQLK